VIKNYSAKANSIPCHVFLLKQAVESKYQTNRSITQRLESHVLELHHRLELAENTNKGKSTRSPENSTAHEVSISSAGSADKPAASSNFSPHSSPLSESLSSTEGSLSGILSGEAVEMKNLQVSSDQCRTTKHENFVLCKIIISGKLIVGRRFVENWLYFLSICWRCVM
jgi:hypothetical protein